MPGLQAIQMLSQWLELRELGEAFIQNAAAYGNGDGLQIARDQLIVQPQRRRNFQSPPGLPPPLDRRHINHRTVSMPNTVSSSEPAR